MRFQCSGECNMYYYYRMSQNVPTDPQSANCSSKEKEVSPQNSLIIFK